MYAARPSRTALRVALRRAAHQINDRPLVFEDPYAIPVLGTEHAEQLRRTPHPDADRKQRPFSLAMRAHLVARSRYAEERLAAAVASLRPAEAVTQYVLLGAGLDTFAHRNPFPHLRVFEVDHPATQAWKRDLLAQSNLPHPPSLTYVPVDFERADFECEALPPGSQSPNLLPPGSQESGSQSTASRSGGPLSARLLASGFDPAQPTFFAMLGVVPYLTLEAFRQTIAFIAAHPRGSGVVFDYGQPRRVLPFQEQLAHDSLSARVALAGEPFHLFFTPSEAACELEEFRLIDDLGADDLNSLYFANRPDDLRMRGHAARLLTAWL